MFNYETLNGMRQGVARGRVIATTEVVINNQDVMFPRGRGVLPGATESEIILFVVTGRCVRHV